MLLLALIGTIGITAHAVSRRRRESAVRLALGANVATVGAVHTNGSAYVQIQGLTFPSTRRCHTHRPRPRASGSSPTPVPCGRNTCSFQAGDESHRRQGAGAVLNGRTIENIRHRRGCGPQRADNDWLASTTRTGGRFAAEAAHQPGITTTVHGDVDMHTRLSRVTAGLLIRHQLWHVPDGFLHVSLDRWGWVREPPRRSLRKVTADQGDLAIPVTL